MRTAGVQVASSIAVGIYVCDGMFLKFVAMGFDPLGRAQQAGLFAVPCAEDDGPLRTPSLFMQLAYCARFLQHRHHARNWVVRAVHPGIKMIPAQYPLPRLIRSAQCGDYVVDR